MVLNYWTLHSINRAIETYLHPHEYTPLQKLQGLRVLLNSQRERAGYKLIPTEPELQERFTNLCAIITADFQPDDQTYREMLDVAHIFNSTAHYLFNHQRETYRARPAPARAPTKPDEKLTLHNVAKDGQNVHITFVNENVKRVAIALHKKYIENLYSPRVNNFITELPTFVDAHDRRHIWTNKHDKSLKFIQTAITDFGIHITLDRLFRAVCAFIVQHEHQRELTTRLLQELEDMSGMCSTGHLARLINVLQGFSEEYSINLDIDKFIRTTIYTTLNKELADSPADVQEGILEKSAEFVAYVKGRAPAFKERFGAEHLVLINQVLDEYISAGQV